MVNRRRFVIIVSVVVVLLALVGAIVGAVILLRGDGAGPTANDDDSTDQLPGNISIENIEALAEPTPQSEATEEQSPESSPSIPPAPTVAPASPSVAVVLSYDTSAGFTVNIDQVTQTIESPTTGLYEPVAGAPFSTLQLLDQDGSVISSQDFSVQTSFFIEDFENSGNNFSHQVSSGNLDFILPVKDRQPTQVRVVTGSSQVLAEQAIDYQALPQDGLSQEPLSRSFISTAHAQSRNFELVIIGIPGADTSAASAAVVNMTSNIAPWPDFPSIRQQSIRWDDDLGCQIIENGPGGFSFPFCGNTGAVLRAAHAAADGAQSVAATVVMPIDCNCGLVAAPNSRVAAVGTRITATTLAHEFAHSIAGLSDEYYGDLGLSGFQGPNCFASETQCLDELDPYKEKPGAKCSLGCNNSSSWRPASQLMYNQPTGFGPLEECLMREKLAGVTGTPFDKGEDCGIVLPSVTPSPVAPPSGAFFGPSR